MSNETTSFLKQHAVTMVMAAITVTSSFVITQQSTNDNTRRIVNLEKYTREVKSISTTNVKDIAVLQEQQKQTALSNREISTLLKDTVAELKQTRLELAGIKKGA